MSSSMNSRPRASLGPPTTTTTTLNRRHHLEPADHGKYFTACCNERLALSHPQDSLKWLRWQTLCLFNHDDLFGGQHFTATATTSNLVTGTKSRYQASTSTPRNQILHARATRGWTSASHYHYPIHISFMLCCYLPLMLLLMLTTFVTESHSNPAPSGFLESGLPIACTIGKPISIGDYIPFADADPSLSKCYSCTCPNGSVVCGHLSNLPECAPQPPTAISSGGKASSSMASKQQAGKHNSKGDRVSPTTTTVITSSHHHNHHNHHHHHHPGKAKTIGVPRKQVKSLATATTIQQKHPPATIGASSTARQPKAAVGSARSFKSGDGEQATRTRMPTQSLSGRRQQPSSQQDHGDLESMAAMPPTRRPYLEELLRTPSLPPDHPEHHVHAAAALNMPLSDYLRKRGSHQQVIEDKRNKLTTTTTSTTPMPTMATTLAEEETNDESTTPVDSINFNTDEQEEPQTQDLMMMMTTTLITTTQSPIASSDLTTTTQPPEAQTTTILPNEESWQTQTPTGVPPPQQPVDENLWPDEGGDHRTGPAIGDLIERDPAILTHDNQPIMKPGLETIAGQHDLSNNSNNNNLNSKIDHNQANEIMEQVWQDGMLYIAIGVEAFILLSIFVMMIIFYMFREKSPEVFPEHHQALQLPRRSPSLEKA